MIASEMQLGEEVEIRHPHRGNFYGRDVVTTTEIGTFVEIQLDLTEVSA